MLLFFFLSSGGKSAFWNTIYVAVSVLFVSLGSCENSGTVVVLAAALTSWIVSSVNGLRLGHLLLQYSVDWHVRYSILRPKTATMTIWFAVVIPDD